MSWTDLTSELMMGSIIQEGLAFELITFLSQMEVRGKIVLKRLLKLWRAWIVDWSQATSTELIELEKR